MNRTGFLNATAWLGLMVCTSPMAANADSLEDLNTRLGHLERLLQSAGTAPADVPVTPRQPELALARPQRDECDREGEELRAEQHLLTERLAAKRETIEALDARVTALRGKLLKDGCTDTERDQLEALKLEIDAVDLAEEKQLVDALLDCTNNKILEGEAKKAALVATKSDNLGVIALGKQLDRLNAFSREVLDLSIIIGSADDLVDRLWLSTEKFGPMCSVDLF